MNDLIDRGDIHLTPAYGFSDSARKIGDTKFVVIQNFLSNLNELGITDTLILNVYFIVNHFSLSIDKEYSIDDSDVLLEKYPLIVSQIKEVALTNLN